jgi:hypothetical protein
VPSTHGPSTSISSESKRCFLGVLGMSLARWRRVSQNLQTELAARISGVTRYYDRLIQWRPQPWDEGGLLDESDCPRKETIGQADEFPDLAGERDTRTAVLLNGTLNYHFDVQDLLQSLHPKLSRNSRVIAICYNPYLRWIYRLASYFNLLNAEVPDTFLTRDALANLARLSEFEIVRTRPAGFIPFRLFGLVTAINRILGVTPVLRDLSFASVVFLRPIKRSEDKPSLSIIIPARDEAGNIESALERLPDFGGAKIEVIFVEGHSSDETWSTIERVVEEWSPRIPCRAYRQTGKGKADAVRLGFSHANCDLLTILDADLTMPPELLTRYYDAYNEGLADFINGSRLVYPMESQAMRFLNQLGNVVFAKMLSVLVETPLSDVLCGTKLVARHDYDRFIRWRNDFGDFDPFGDFELIFPAAVIALGIIDIPVRYRDRTYGSTSIRRFAHGFELLKMTAVGLARIKLGSG